METEELSQQVLLKMDGYDDCIVGVVEQFGRPDIICYDKKKVLNKLMEEMSEDEAEEFFYFNQVGAYVGESTPCFISFEYEI
jgi:hypothetical protein